MDHAQRRSQSLRAHNFAYLANVISKRIRRAGKYLWLRLVAVAFVLTFPEAYSQVSCIPGPPAFKSSEELTYRVVYNWGLVWLESGHAEFKVTSGNSGGRQTFMFLGSGGTFPKYDWFFRVRDLFTAELDSQTFRPVKFQASMQEGSKNDRHTYLFNQQQKRAYTVITRGKKKPEIDTVPMHTCTMDVLSAIYYARSIDYSGYKTNDTIGVSLLIDGKIFAIYIRYLGRDTYQSKELGKFRCVKFSPLLVEGSIFKKGEGMTVWVTDDENKVPLFIETPIVVGTIKVILGTYKNLKYQLKSKIANG
jgi:hypothetical protein